MNHLPIFQFIIFKSTTRFCFYYWIWQITVKFIEKHCLWLRVMTDHNSIDSIGGLENTRGKGTIVDISRYYPQKIKLHLLNIFVQSSARQWKWAANKLGDGDGDFLLLANKSSFICFMFFLQISRNQVPDELLIRSGPLLRCSSSKILKQ